MRHANERHIEVIPEFDMPGHMHAGIRAMEARSVLNNNYMYVCLGFAHLISCRSAPPTAIQTSCCRTQTTSRTTSQCNTSATTPSTRVSRRRTTGSPRSSMTSSLCTTFVQFENNDRHTLLGKMLYICRLFNLCATSTSEATRCRRGLGWDRPRAKRTPLTTVCNVMHMGSCFIFVQGWIVSGIDFTQPALKEHFTVEISEIANSKNMLLAGWEDGLMEGLTPYNRSQTRNEITLEMFHVSVFCRSAFPNEQVLAYAWNNVWEWGSGSRAYILANEGYQARHTPVHHCLSCV